MKKVKLLLKEPGEAEAKEIEIVDKLGEYQRLVGGYIEVYTLPDEENLVIICNEEGRLLGLLPNIEYRGVPFCGNVLIAATEGEEFASLNENQVKAMKEYLKYHSIY